MKPIFSYMGSKYNFFSAYQELGFYLDPADFDTFVDLFAGGLSVTLDIAEKYPDKSIIINDLNLELIQLYRHIRDNFADFLQEYETVKLKFILSEPENRRNIYYETRQTYLEFTGKKNSVKMSATLLTLLQFCFSGVWRSSKKFSNRFFTAYSSDCDRYQPRLDSAALYRLHEVLKRCEIVHGCFQDLKIPKKSWIFADPPYRGRTDKNLYNSGGFDDDAQKSLAEFLLKAGCPVAFANLDLSDGFWEQAFGPGFTVHKIPTLYKSGLNKKGPLVAEALVKNY